MKHRCLRVDRSNRPAYTLVELLVVVAIIGMLASLLLPAFAAVRESARRTTCANNLRQMGLAAESHAKVREVYPASWPSDDPTITWGRALLPFLDHQSLYHAWDDDLGFFEGANGELCATFLPVYKCPSAPSKRVYSYEQTGYPPRLATVDYKGCQGANASDPAVAHWGLSGWVDGVISRRPTTPAEIRDGISNTLLLVESVGGTVIYGPDRRPTTPARIWYATDGSWVGRALSSASPADHAYVKGVTPCHVNCSNMYDYGPYAFHPGGAQVVLGGGSVRFLSESIAPELILGLYSYNEGQVIDDF